ncbi:MAG: hypothetical protein ACREOJ_15405 [Gemmatimonadaceae bacterium]
MRLQLLGGSLAMLWMVTPMPAHAASAPRAVRATPVMRSAGVVAPRARHHPAAALAPIAPPARSSIKSPRAVYTLLSQASDTTVVSGVRIAAVLDGGSWIELADGTRWEVFLADRPNTDNWRAGDFVNVRFLPIMLGDRGRFRYQFVNGREGNEAAVRFSGVSGQ